MRLLHCSYHPEANTASDAQIQRQAARAIVLNGDDILLLYTQRYDDYSLPGGGVDDGEALETALVRELQEETGAHNIQNIQAFGAYEEFRPWYKTGADVLRMHSYCFTCTIADDLRAPQLEDYEQKNGMRPLWVNIHAAIAHNEYTMMHSAKKGMSIERETYLLKRIVAELLN
mgnify:CR=1 FL=1